ncbi:peptidase [Halioxenophilus sp. WMMB6]|uniref:peptidase n=1 Tax=Halioxenophilus sp. WMMB6 TaxID=3073815 RepID=UPI00295E7B97|nr:peptidase [Halioxenophilus sp. WMMB6]
MTYCLGIKVNQGIVMVSDSRTSAGVDNISSYSKMWRYGVPGQRQFVICAAGNLATTQAVITQVETDIAKVAPVSLNTVATLAEAAAYLGKVNVKAQKSNTGGGPLFECTFLLAGEILGSSNGLYLIYSEGNYIAASNQKPFLQVGETKYGKPILDRVIVLETPIESAALCALVSMDATIRSNLTVGPPIELAILETGTLQPGYYYSYSDDDEFLRDLRSSWDSLMQQAFQQLQPLPWQPTRAPAPPVSQS